MEGSGPSPSQVLFDDHGKSESSAESAMQPERSPRANAPSSAKAQVIARDRLFRENDIALLDHAGGSRLFDGSNDHIAHTGVSAACSAKNADAKELFGAGVIGNLHV